MCHSPGPRRYHLCHQTRHRTPGEASQPSACPLACDRGTTAPNSGAPGTEINKRYEVGWREAKRREKEGDELECDRNVVKWNGRENGRVSEQEGEEKESVRKRGIET